MLNDFGITRTPSLNVTNTGLISILGLKEYVYEKDNIFWPD